jgi:hypothetical protein
VSESVNSTGSGAVEAGQSPRTQAAPSGGKEVEKAPLSNIRDRMLAGGPSHKAVIKSFFDEVRKNAESLPSADANWADTQNAMRQFSKEQTGLDALSDKEKNYLLVANIMNNKEMIQSAASFFSEVAEVYNDNPNVKADSNPDVKHGWPDKDLSSNKNQSERGWTGMAVGVAKSKVGLDSRSLLDGLKEFAPQMKELSTKEGELSLEETTFVVRGMAVLRDVMKAFKKTDTKEFVNENKLSNIVEKGVEGRAFTARMRVTAHASLQRDPSFRVDPDATLAQVAQAAKDVVQDRYHAEVDKWDYNQGPSGTTLDFENFCQMFLVKEEGADLEVAKDRTLGLMQVMYAYWHFCAHDGFAHSQDESISTMLDAMYGLELTTPIVAPIRSSDDVNEMKETQHKELNYCESPEEPRTVHVKNGYQKTNG